MTMSPAETVHGGITGGGTADDLALQAGTRGDRSVIGLDLLRALAAIQVFFGHVRAEAFVDYGALPHSSHNWLVAAAFGMTRIGRESVLIFFVLSGYLVFGQVLRRSAENRFDIAAYGVDRVTRIFIPLIPACLLTISLDWVAFGNAPDTFQTVSNMLGLNGVVANTLRIDQPLWTLAYEIWFYVIGGAIGYLFASRFRSGLASMALVVSIAVFSVLSARFLLYWLAAGFIVWHLNSRLRTPMAAIGVVLAFAGIALVETSSASKAFTAIAVVPPAVAEFTVCAGTVLTFPFLCSPAVNERLSFLRTPARALSAISFSLYLIHYPVNASLDLILPRAQSLGWVGMQDFLIRIAVCLAVVLVFYFLFERNTAAARAFLGGKYAPVANAAD